MKKNPKGEEMAHYQALLGALDALFIYGNRHPRECACPICHLWLESIPLRRSLGQPGYESLDAQYELQYRQKREAEESLSSASL